MSATHVPLGGNEAPVDLAAVQADDALLDMLRAGEFDDLLERADAPYDPASVAYAEMRIVLARVLVAWRRDVDAEPIPVLVPPDPHCRSVLCSGRCCAPRLLPRAWRQAMSYDVATFSRLPGVPTVLSEEQVREVAAKIAPAIGHDMVMDTPECSGCDGGFCGGHEPEPGCDACAGWGWPCQVAMDAARAAISVAVPAGVVAELNGLSDRLLSHRDAIRPLQSAERRLQGLEEAAHWARVRAEELAKQRAEALAPPGCVR